MSLLRLSVAVGITLTLISTPAAAQTPSTAARADMKCMAVFAVMLGSLGEDPIEADAEMAAGAASALSYYLGRLQGRDPDTDWMGVFGEALEDVTLEELSREAPRCGKEMEAVGSALVAFGDKFGG